jgi:putative flavoprotein involved in K+ transport
MEIIDLIIIGAGPAGLRAAEEAHLLKIDYLMLEKGEVGQAWREIRPEMPMLSPSHPQRDWTSISADFPIWKLPVQRPFCQAREFVDYLEAYVQYLKPCLKINTPVQVIRKKDNVFSIETPGAEFRCNMLLVCTGMFGNPYIPNIQGLRNHPRVMHSHHYKIPQIFHSQRVLVIGGGNSAAEIAIELAGHAQVYLLTREPLKFFSKTSNLCDIRGISESFLLELIRMKLIYHLEGIHIKGVDDRFIYLEDPASLQFDQIICATGYRPVLDFLSDLSPQLDDATQFPLITEAGEATEIKNLFFAGPLAYRGMGSLFIHGFIKDIPRIMSTIQNRLQA